MSEIKIVATLRENFGKGAARKLRASHQTPAVIYGHGNATRHISLPAHEIALALRHKNALLELNLNGKTELVLVKMASKDPVTQIIEHVDLVIVRKGETVTVNIPVVMIGHPFPGTVALIEHQTLTVEAEATHIPEHIEIDVTGMTEHTHVSAKDVALPEGVTLHLDPETIIIAVQNAPRADALENEEPAAAAAPAAADSE